MYIAKMRVKEINDKQRIVVGRTKAVIRFTSQTMKVVLTKNSTVAVGIRSWFG